MAELYKKIAWKNIKCHLHQMVFLALPRLVWSNCFNPFYTLFLNLAFFPFCQAVRFPVFVYGWPRLLALDGRMRCVEKARSGMVRLNITCSGAPQYSGMNLHLNNSGTMLFHSGKGKIIICAGSKINVGRKGMLEMGAGSKIMAFCNITAYSKIGIGAQSRIVHRCQLLDTNFHYVADFKRGQIRRQSHPILIGDYCWVCNSTTVTGGVVLPDKTIVASNSLVNKNMSGIPEESVIGGIPAVLIATGRRRVESMKLECEVNEYFEKHPNADAYPLPEACSHAVCDVD